MKKAIVRFAALWAGMAVAMPNASELEAARSRVAGAAASEVEALAASERSAASVADGQVRKAKEAENEAVMYLLLQGAFKLYAKAGDYEAAAQVLETMSRDISGMRTDVVVELCNKAMDVNNPSRRLAAIRDEAALGHLPGTPKPEAKPVVTAGNTIPEKPVLIPESIVLPISEGVRIAFVRCPPKTFSMSDATGASDVEHAHKVTLTRDYWIATASLPKALCPSGGLVTVKAFLADLNRRHADKLPPNTVLRLPTEAEWEGAIQGNAFTSTYDFEATCETVTAKYAKKYAWKSELDPLVYASTETDPYRTTTVNPAWLCRQSRTNRFLLRPNASNVTLRLAVGAEVGN